MKMALWMIPLLLLAAGTASAGELRATVREVKPQQGRLMVALYDGEAAYEAQRRYAGSELPAAGDTATVVFADLPAGSYALTLYQDVDGDGKLGRNLLGLPTEPYGFSRDAHATLGMPSFAEMAVTVGNGVTAVTVTLVK